MSVQKEQCKVKGIELSISYLNINENNVGVPYIDGVIE